MKCTDAYASAQPVCPGCATSIQPGLAMGRVVPVCMSCYGRAQSSPQFQRLIAGAAAAGTNVPYVRSLFARAGVPEAPTTADEVRAAIALICAHDPHRAAWGAH